MTIAIIEKQIINVYMLCTISSNPKVRQYVIQRLVDLVELKRKALSAATGKA